MSKARHWKGIVLGVALVVAAAPAAAGDGRIEINQAQALAGGVTAGDTPGFPVDLNEPGAYLLTGNLILPDLNTTGIRVLADNVTLDLNGFAIRGPGGGTGTGNGIDFTSDTPPVWGHGITVRNGRVQGVGNVGISASIVGHAVVERVRAMYNGDDGFKVVRGVIRDSIAEGNGGDGIAAGPGVLIQNNTSTSNGGHGILADYGNVISGNSARSNSQNGIQTFDGCNVERNVANNNGADGIQVGGDSRVDGNVTRNNGDDGIQTNGGADSIVTNNVSSQNDYGFFPHADTAMGGNHISGNTILDMAGTGTGILISCQVVSDTQSCPP